MHMRGFFFLAKIIHRRVDSPQRRRDRGEDLTVNEVKYCSLQQYTIVFSAFSASLR